MKSKNKTKQNRTRNREQGIINEIIWPFDAKKKMISERFEGRAILATRITSEFKMAVMLSSNTLLTCSVIVLLRQIDFTSSRLFIWPAMFALKLAWWGGRWGEGAGKKILSTRSPKLRQFWRLMRFGLFLIILFFSFLQSYSCKISRGASFIHGREQFSSLPGCFESWLSGYVCSVVCG